MTHPHDSCILASQQVLHRVVNVRRVDELYHVAKHRKLVLVLPGGGGVSHGRGNHPRNGCGIRVMVVVSDGGGRMWWRRWSMVTSVVGGVGGGSSGRGQWW